MSKRKLAVAMAGAMVATAVVPAFAAETVVKKTIEKGSAEATKLVDDLRNQLANGTKFAKDDTFEDQWVNTIVVQKIANDQAGKDFDIETILNTALEAKNDAAPVTTSGEITTASGLHVIDNAIILEETIASLKTDERLFVAIVDKGHASVNGKISSVEADGTTDLAEEVLARVEITNPSNAIKTVKHDIADFYDGEFLTAEGFDLLNVIKDAKTADGYNTKEFKATTANAKINTDVKTKTITVEFAIDYVNPTIKDEQVNLVISSSDLGHLQAFGAILDGTKTVNASKIAGENRYATAVEIAKEVDKISPLVMNQEKSVVLVNSTSMIDGLTAAPFASATNSNVLLTKVNEVPEETMDYLESTDVKKVTIIGGKSVVSDEVVKQLNKVGITVTRIGGEDRHETSVLVAKALQDLGKLGTDAFVIAATGEADAMSVAPVASEVVNGKVAPIIVEGFNGISKYSKTLLNGKEIAVIGGKVTEDTKLELRKIDAQAAVDQLGEIDVIAGVDRFETNAKVINKYYVNGVDNIYVAKDGYGNNESLVDALAVGGLASYNSPVVLATNELTVKQVEAVKRVKDANTGVVQVGNGVKHSVVKSIAKIIGLGNIIK